MIILSIIMIKIYLKNIHILFIFFFLKYFRKYLNFRIKNNFNFIYITHIFYDLIIISFI